MAHLNIVERRNAVRQLLNNGKLTSFEIKKVAEQFNCNVSAVRADVVAINNENLDETYHVSPKKRLEVIARDGMVCYLCGEPIDNAPVIEHKTPASRGGTANLDNLAVAHQSCNIRKRYNGK